MTTTPPIHCSKPMRRSETKKGHPWWCSECGEYMPRGRLNARTTPRASVIRAAVISALRNEFGHAPNVEVAISGSIAHITVSGIDLARASKEDFEVL